MKVLPSNIATANLVSLTNPINHNRTPFLSNFKKDMRTLRSVIFAMTIKGLVTKQRRKTNELAKMKTNQLACSQLYK